MATGIPAGTILHSAAIVVEWALLLLLLLLSGKFPKLTILNIHL
jgi:hypothetical protein